LKLNWRFYQARVFVGKRSFVPTQRYANITRHSSREIDDLVLNFVSARPQVCLPEFENFLWESSQCFFPTGLHLVDGASTIRAKLVWESSNFDLRQPISHGAFNDRCRAL